MGNDVRHIVLDRFTRDLIRRKAKQIARRRGFSRSDVDDIEQDLTLHLLERAPSFNPATGHLRTFVTTVVERKVASLLRDRAAQCRRGECDSLNAIVTEEAGDLVELSSELEESVRQAHRAVSLRGEQETQDLVMDVEDVIARLPEDLRQLCYRLAHASATEVARALGIPRRTLRDRMEAIREHFEKAGLKGYVIASAE